jgi:hypothetical protein
MLPTNEATFELVDDKGQPYVGDKTGKKYEGQFTVKCVLTNAESMQVAINAERYNGGVATLPQYYRLFNRALAEAETRVCWDKEKKKARAPGWWVDSDLGRELLDQNVVFEIYNKCMAAEKEWQAKLGVKAGEAEKAADLEPPKKG